MKRILEVLHILFSSDVSDPTGIFRDAWILTAVVVATWATFILLIVHLTKLAA